MKSHILFFTALLAILPACSTTNAPFTPPTRQRTPVTYADDLSPAFKMTQRRAAHTATMLRDGDVLLAGGFIDDGRGNETTIASAELYDSKTNTFTAISDMTEPRVGHGASLLPDGRVLLAGGWGQGVRLSSAEIYDPKTNSFSRIPGMAASRDGMTTIALRDGRVLIAGGFRARNALNETVEIYDPRTGAFSAIGKMAEPRSIHTATVLKDGMVLFVGGTSTNDRVLQSAEIFDPKTNTFTRVGDLKAPRRKHAATLLPDGRVLIIGGSNDRDWTGQYDSTEIYDPKTRAFTPGPKLNADRFKLADAVVTLANGNVLVSGGDKLIERFDLTSNRFVSGKQLDQDYFSATSTLLPDGSVLIAGGYNRDIVVSNSAWIYK